MSGHSKWTQIKRQKGAADVKRGQTFTKLAGAIIIAVRQGGGIGDPDQNFKLRLIIEKARQVNMPKENIERAIEKGTGKSDKGEGFSEVAYEGFGPGKISLIIEAATDNKQRTTSEVKNVLEKNGAILGLPGSVSYQFETRGLINVVKNGGSTDDIFLLAADAGALDIEEGEDEVFVYTKPEELAFVRDTLSGKVSVIDAELIRKPIVTVPIHDKETAEKIMTLIHKLEELDDVQKVYSNFDIPDEFILVLNQITNA